LLVAQGHARSPGLHSTRHSHNGEQPVFALGWSQVLELVLCHGQDIKALVIGSTLNQHFQSYARHTAQLSARSLLHTWKAAVSQHTPQGPLLKQRSWKEQQLQCLLWLCKTAGPQFVNSHHAACSLLHTLKSAPLLAADDVLTTLKDAGA
jgi:hypothetical protein